LPDPIAVPIGAFADPTFPAPTVSGWEERRHPWPKLPAAMSITTDVANRETEEGTSCASRSSSS
jgi:hypothetical protein